MRAWKELRTHLALWLALIAADVAINIVLLLQLHGWSLSWMGSGGSLRASLRSFRSDALDALVLALVRGALLAALLGIGLRWGTPAWARERQRYEGEMEARKGRERAWRRKHGGANAQSNAAAAGLNEPLLVDAGSPAASLSLNGATTSSSSSKLDHTGSSASWTSGTDADVEDASISSSSASSPSLAAWLGPPPSPPPVLSLSDKLSDNRSALARQRLVQVAIFCVGVAFQAVLGVKMVAFDFSAGHDGGASSEALRASLMACSLIAINLECGGLRGLLRKRLQEEGILMLCLHPHKMYYNEDDVLSNHCDLCRNRIKGGYTCRPCDFDCCLTCFARKEKAQHSAAERRRRGEGLGANLSNEGDKEIGSFQFMLRALAMALPHWRVLLVAGVCLLATSAAAIALPSFQGSILDHVVAGDRHAFISSVRVFVGVSIALGVFGAVRNLCFSLVGARIAAALRVQLYAVLMMQPVDFFDAAAQGELHQRLGWDCQNTSTPVQSALSSAASNILLLTGGCIMCIVTSWRLSVLAFCALYPIAVVTRAYASWSAWINRSILSSYGEATNVAGQALANIRTVRSFGTQNFEVLQFNSYIFEGLSKSVKDAWVGGGAYTLTTLLDLATGTLTLYYGGSVVLDGGSNSTELSIGKLITFNLYYNLLSNAYASLNDLLTVFTRASGSAQRVFTLLDNLPRADPLAGEVVTKESVKGDIEIKDLHFAYALRPENEVVRGVNLHIRPNTVTALVGRSGGGKSTLVHLLCRFYEPVSGSILLDGRPLPSLQLESLQRQFAVVTQSTELFGGSVLQNLTYGLKEDEWTMADVHAACVEANCLDFILGFEEGFSTRVGERGVRLSGGQRQRLSLARAMLRRASILLLDEATSSLDAESEALVQSALDALIARGQCTILLVAHRLSTVINADQIAVLDRGVIAERGTHDELLAHKKDGIYAKLVQRQMMRKQNLIEEAAVAASVTADTVSSGGSTSTAAAGSASAVHLATEVAQKLAAVDDVDAIWDESEQQQQQQQPQPEPPTQPSSPSPLPSPFSNLEPSPPSDSN